MELKTIDCGQVKIWPTCIILSWSSKQCLRERISHSLCQLPDANIFNDEDPIHPMDSIWAMMTCWQLRGKIISNVLCCLVYLSCAHMWAVPNFSCWFSFLFCEFCLGLTFCRCFFCHSQSLAPVSPDWFYLPGFTILVPAHPGSPGQNLRGLLNSCLCVFG